MLEAVLSQDRKLSFISENPGISSEIAVGMTNNDKIFNSLWEPKEVYVQFLVTFKRDDHDCIDPFEPKRLQIFIQDRSDR